MSYVLLPSSPAPMIIEPQQIDYGGVLSPPLGGTDQRVNRNGNRWALRIQMPLMEEPEAGLWVGALTRGQRYGVRLPLIQADVNIGIPGSPLVNGSGQGLRLLRQLCHGLSPPPRRGPSRERSLR